MTFVDEFVYELLTEERVCDIILPRLQKRQVLEENGEIGPRKSRLLAAMEDEDKSDKSRSKSSSRSPSRGTSIGRSRVSGSAGRSSSSRSRSRSLISDTGSRVIHRSPSVSRSLSQQPDKSGNDMDIDGMS